MFTMSLRTDPSEFRDSAYVDNTAVIGYLEQWTSRAYVQREGDRQKTKKKNRRLRQLSNPKTRFSTRSHVIADVST